MSKELRELLAQLEAKKTEVRSLMTTDVDAAETTMEEVRSLQKKIEVQRSLDEAENDTNDDGTKVEPGAGEDGPEYRDVFMMALRNKPLNAEQREVLESKTEEIRAMSGATDEDGGLVIPKDVQTKINEFARAFDALENYVTVENVSTRSGSRVLEANADMVPFAEITEMGDIPETDNPKFTTLAYAIKDRAGILPLSRSLLKDSDQNILTYVTKWLGKKSKVTRNVLILAAINTLTKKAIKDIDDIKDVLDVQLDPAITASAIILTNQDGFNYLNKLKNQDGTYLLEKDPKVPTRKLLDGRPVVVISNKFLKTTAGKAPIVIGDLKEAVVLFKREEMELASTEVGGKAFTRNTLDVRAIQRDDVKVWDSEAAIYGEITIPPTV